MKSEKPIRNQKDLEKRIRQLENEKIKLENNIVDRGSEIYNIVTDPAPIIKKAARDLAADSNFRSDVFNIALSVAAKYIGKKMSGNSGAQQATESLLDRLFGKKENAGGEKDTEEGLISRIAEFFRKKDKKKKS